MIVYGTKINSDIEFPLDISHETEMQYVVELSFHPGYHYHLTPIFHRK